MFKANAGVRKKRQKEDILDALEVYIYDALSECDYVKNNLLIDPPNIDKLYEHLCFAVISIKCAAQDLKKFQCLINADEF